MKNKGVSGTLIILMALVSIMGAMVVSCQSTNALTSSDYPAIVSAGTGFFITADGYVVTCAHVVEDADVIGVWVGGDGYRAELVAINHETDIAILKIDYRPSRYFRLADFNNVRRGDGVYALGFPMTNVLGSEIRITDGIVSALSGVDGDQTRFQMSAPVQGGNSGGPVIRNNNGRFELVGIVTSKITGTDVDNISFAVKNIHIAPLLPAGVRLRGGNVRGFPDAERATVQISIVDDIVVGPPVDIVNNTGFEVTVVYISPRIHSSWGQNRLQRNQIVHNNEEIRLRLPQELNYGNRYDMRMVAVNGNAYELRNVLVFNESRHVFGPEHLVHRGAAVGPPSGLYTFSSNDSITFTGNNFTLRTGGQTIAGTFSVSGNTFTLTGHNRSESWIRSPWTIVDSNTIQDSDGDVWRGSATPPVGGLSGTYNYNQLLFITFNGNNFSLRVADAGTFTGRVTVSGNTFTLTNHDFDAEFMTGRWTIIDSDTIRDSDGDLWRR